jgi:hypothetical protein
MSSRSWCKKKNAGKSQPGAKCAILHQILVIFSVKQRIIKVLCQLLSTLQLSCNSAATQLLKEMAQASLPLKTSYNIHHTSSLRPHTLVA